MYRFWIEIQTVAFLEQIFLYLGFQMSFIVIRSQLMPFKAAPPGTLTYYNPLGQLAPSLY